MLTKLNRLSPMLLFLLPLAAVPASALQVEVTIENVAPEGGVLLTPVWVGFHDASFDSYDGGAPASDFPGLEQIAEDGNSGPLSDDFARVVPQGTQATIPGPGGPLRPGDRAVMRFNLDPNSAFSRYFSYVSMVIPSNDAFVANGNPRAHRVFDTNGVFTPVEFSIFGREVNDAGTEVNDELPANTAALGQAAPNTGVDENGVVFDHMGFIPGGNVLGAIPNGQFIRPGYEIARVTVKAVRGTEISFYGSAAQEVETVDSEAVAACSASVNQAQTRLTVSCEHDVDRATAAHVHVGAAGENGPVVFPFDDPASPFSQTFDLTDEDILNFYTGNFYVNIHSAAFPPGEVRAQIDGCFDSPTSLCLNSDRFQVTTAWETLDGNQGTGRSIPETDDTGFFYFFTKDNLELSIKVIDGCEENGHYWVFAAGLTDVGVDLTIEDTQAGVSRTYNNLTGNSFSPILDIEAFATCP